MQRPFSGAELLPAPHPLAQAGLPHAGAAASPLPTPSPSPRPPSATGMPRKRPSDSFAGQLVPSALEASAALQWQAATAAVAGVGERHAGSPHPGLNHAAASPTSFSGQEEQQYTADGVPRSFSVPPSHAGSPGPVPQGNGRPNGCDSPDLSPTAADLFSEEALPKPQTVLASPIKPAARATPAELLAAQRAAVDLYSRSLAHAHAQGHNQEDSVMMEPLDAPLPSPSPTDHFANVNVSSAADGRSLITLQQLRQKPAPSLASLASTPSPPMGAVGSHCGVATINAQQNGSSAACNGTTTTMLLPPAHDFDSFRTARAQEHEEVDASVLAAPAVHAANDEVDASAMATNQPVETFASGSDANVVNSSSGNGIIIRSTSVGGPRVVIAAQPVMPPLPSWCGLPQPHPPTPSSIGNGAMPQPFSFSPSSSPSSSLSASAPAGTAAATTSSPMGSKRMKTTPLSSPSSSRAPRLGLGASSGSGGGTAGGADASDHAADSQGTFVFDSSPLVSSNIFAQQLSQVGSSNNSNGVSNGSAMRDASPLRPLAPLHPLTSSAPASSTSPSSSSTSLLSRRRSNSPRPHHAPSAHQHHHHHSQRHSPSSQASPRRIHSPRHLQQQHSPLKSPSSALNAAAGTSAVPNYFWELQVFPASAAPAPGSASSSSAPLERISLWSRPCWLLGRHTSCDVVLDHISISRLHARLLIHSASGQLYLQDLDSTHGTTVNGTRVLGMKKAALQGNAQTVDARSGGLASFTLAATPSPSAAGAVLLARGSHIVFGAHTSRVYVVVQHDSMPSATVSASVPSSAHRVESPAHFSGTATVPVSGASSPAAAAMPALRKAVSDGSIPNSPVVVMLPAPVPVGLPAMGLAGSGGSGGAAATAVALGVAVGTGTARPLPLLLHSTTSAASAGASPFSSLHPAELPSAAVGANGANQSALAQRKKKRVSFAASAKRSDGAYVLRAERSVFTAWREREAEAGAASAETNHAGHGAAMMVDYPSVAAASTGDVASLLHRDPSSSSSSSPSNPSSSSSSPVPGQHRPGVAEAAEALARSEAEEAETVQAVQAAEEAALAADEEAERMPKRQGMTAEEICMQRKMAASAAAVAVPILKLPSFPFAPRAFSAPPASAPAAPVVATPSFFSVAAPVPSTPCIGAIGAAAARVPATTTGSMAGSTFSGPRGSSLSVAIGSSVSSGGFPSYAPSPLPAASPVNSPFPASAAAAVAQRPSLKHARDPMEDDVAVRLTVSVGGPASREEDDKLPGGSDDADADADGGATGGGDDDAAPAHALSPEERVAVEMYQQLLPQPVNSPASSASFTSLSLMSGHAAAQHSAHFAAHQTRSVPVQQNQQQQLHNGHPPFAAAGGTPGSSSVNSVSVPAVLSPFGVVSPLFGKQAPSPLGTHAVAASPAVVAAAASPFGAAPLLAQTQASQTHPQYPAIAEGADSMC